VQTRSQIAALQARLGTTTVYVTHDQVEAMTMGHRVAVLKDGLLQQVDTPRALYDRPKNAFVAGFIGSPAMNIKTVRIADGGAQLGSLVFPLDRSQIEQARTGGADTVTVGFRPESTDLVGPHDGGLPMVVDLVEELGSDVYGHAKLGNENDDRLVVRTEGRTPPKMGDTVYLRMQPEHLHAFHAITGERLV
jgi:multiple sugar transport system ATP-binding protein